jgi:hypothetical protein
MHVVRLTTNLQRKKLSSIGFEGLNLMAKDPSEYQNLHTLQLEKQLNVCSGKWSGRGNLA